MKRTLMVLAGMLFVVGLLGHGVVFGFSPAGTPISQVDKGSIVEFGGKRWIVLDPGERKLLLHQDDVAGTYFFGSSHCYEPTEGSTNSLYRILNEETDRDGDPTFYADLGDEKRWIEPRNWNVRSEAGDILCGDGEVEARIGLLTKAEYETYRNDSELNIGAKDTFLLTPTNDGGLWRVFVEFGVPRLEVIPSYEVPGARVAYRPVVYLSDHLYVSGGLGTADDPHVLSELPMSMNPNQWTNQDVTVAVTFPQGATDPRYEIGVTGAVYYTGPFTVSENGIFLVTYSLASETITERGKVSHIDKIAPVISGVEDGMIYAAPIELRSQDQDIEFVQLTRDGEPVPGYHLDEPIASNGQYRLTVADKAGNVTVINFRIEIADENRPSVLGAYIENDGYLDVIVVAVDQPISINWDVVPELEVRTASGEPIENFQVYSWGNYMMIDLFQTGLPPGERALLHIPGHLFSANHLPNLPVTDLWAEDARIYPGEDGRIGIREIAAHVRKWKDVEYYGLDEFMLEYLLDMIQPIHPVEGNPYP